MSDNYGDAFDLWYYDKFESCEPSDILRGDAALLRSYAKDGWDAAIATKRESAQPTAWDMEVVDVAAVSVKDVALKYCGYSENDSINTQIKNILTAAGVKYAT